MLVKEKLKDVFGNIQKAMGGQNHIEAEHLGQERQEYLQEKMPPSKTLNSFLDQQRQKRKLAPDVQEDLSHMKQILQQKEQHSQKTQQKQLINFQEKEIEDARQINEKISISKQTQEKYLKKKQELSQLIQNFNIQKLSLEQNIDQQKQKQTKALQQIELALQQQSLILEQKNFQLSQKQQTLNENLEHKQRNQSQIQLIAQNIEQLKHQISLLNSKKIPLDTQILLNQKKIKSQTEMFQEAQCQLERYRKINLNLGHEIHLMQGEISHKQNDFFNLQNTLSLLKDDTEQRNIAIQQTKSIEQDLKNQIAILEDQKHENEKNCQQLKIKIHKTKIFFEAFQPDLESEVESLRSQIAAQNQPKNQFYNDESKEKEVQEQIEDILQRIEQNSKKIQQARSLETEAEQFYQKNRERLAQVEAGNEDLERQLRETQSFYTLNFDKKRMAIDALVKENEQIQSSLQ